MFAGWLSIVAHWSLVAILLTFFIGVAAYFMGLITNIPRWAIIAAVAFVLAAGVLTILDLLL